MDKIVSRLNRIEGQVRGIRRMYEGEKECLALVQQIAAVRQALARVGKDLLTSEAVRCAKSPRKKVDLDKILKSLFEIS